MTAKKKTDPVWGAIRSEALSDANSEPLLASFLHSTILNHTRLEAALSFHLAMLLGNRTLQPIQLNELFLEAMDASPAIQEAIRADITAVVDRDPACRHYSVPLLYFKGYHGLQAYRVANYFWTRGRHNLARMLQSRISESFSMDIHPAAKIGQGILIDHAHSIVIGETAVVGDNVSLIHEVTLGGTGKDQGDRHPKIGCGVLIGAGAKILGNVKVGEGAKVGAGSVVLEDVPAHCTVVGVPAKVVGHPRADQPALSMDQRIMAEGI